MMPLSNVEGFTEKQLADPVFRLTCGQIAIVISAAFCIMATPLGTVIPSRRLTSIHEITMNEAPASVLTLSEKDKARFWAKVDKNGPLPDQSNPHYSGLGQCWVWIGGLNSNGYGKMRIGDASAVPSHRISFHINIGPIPEGNLVCHRCDVPNCINPSHLFAGTPKANIRDMVAKGRSNKASGEHHGTKTKPEKVQRGSSHYTQRNPSLIRHGSAIYNAKLDASMVRKIRESHGKGMTTQKELAADYGVSAATINRIVKQLSYKDV